MQQEYYCPSPLYTKTIIVYYKYVASVYLYTCLIVTRNRNIFVSNKITIIPDSRKIWVLYIYKKKQEQKCHKNVHKNYQPPPTYLQLYVNRKKLQNALSDAKIIKYGAFY